MINHLKFLKLTIVFRASLTVTIIKKLWQKFESTSKNYNFKNYNAYSYQKNGNFAIVGLKKSVSFNFGKKNICFYALPKLKGDMSFEKGTKIDSDPCIYLFFSNKTSNNFEIAGFSYRSVH